MRIPKDVILIWTGLNSNIPSGWTRETLLDDKYPKAWGNENPNVTGGSATHSHTTQPHSHNLSNHNHSYTLNPDPNTNFGGVWGGGQSIRDGHTHTGTSGNVIGGTTSSDSFTTGQASNLPPYYEVIFIKAGLTSLLQNGIIALWGNNNPPSDWQICNGDNGSPDLRNRYIKGAPTNGNAGGIGGSYYNTHSLNHTHTPSQHYHATSTSNQSSDTRAGSGGSNDWAVSYWHTHQVSFGNSTQNINAFTGNYNTSEIVEPAYKKVLAIQFKTGAIKRKGIIGLWLGDVNNIPKGWVLCDGNNGTIDLRDKFIKIANTPDEVGMTGGSNTHTHANFSHSHTGNTSHTHSASSDAHQNNPTQIQANNASSQHRTIAGNYHQSISVNSVLANYDNANIVFNQADNQPPYRTVAYIQFQKEIYGGGMLLNFL